MRRYTIAAKPIGVSAEGNVNDVADNPQLGMLWQIAVLDENNTVVSDDQLRESFNLLDAEGIPLKMLGECDTETPAGKWAAENRAPDFALIEDITADTVRLCDSGVHWEVPRKYVHALYEPVQGQIEKMITPQGAASTLPPDILARLKHVAHNLAEQIRSGNLPESGAGIFTVPPMPEPPKHNITSREVTLDEYILELDNYTIRQLTTDIRAETQELLKKASGLIADGTFVVVAAKARLHFPDLSRKAIGHASLRLEGENA